MGPIGNHSHGSRLPDETGGNSSLKDACLDLTRESRKGVPEIVWAGNKEPAVVVEIARRFVEETGRAIISRADDATRALLREVLGTDVDIEENSRAKMVVARKAGTGRKVDGGFVGIVTAGTSDIPVAEEARIVAEEMGCHVETAYDVGVAGLHRLFGPLSAMVEDDVDVIIVAAGMDGALPSVVSGLVGVPVIGLPTSVGYGLGGAGVTAILSMLQTCSPGLTVVNIDNGVGAGATAAMIANRVARARLQSQ